MVARIASLIYIALLFSSPARAAQVSSADKAARMAKVSAAIAARKSSRLAPALAGQLAPTPSKAAPGLALPPTEHVGSGARGQASGMTRLKRYLAPSFYTRLRLFQKSPRGPGTEQISIGDRMADAVAKHGGSWPYVLTLSATIGGWIAYNLLSGGAPDGDLSAANVAISILTVLQGPFLIMNANRQAKIDRSRAERDLEADLHTESSVSELHGKVDSLSADVRRLTEALSARDKAAAPPTVE